MPRRLRSRQVGNILCGVGVSRGNDRNYTNRTRFVTRRHTLRSPSLTNMHGGQSRIQTVLRDLVILRASPSGPVRDPGAALNSKAFIMQMKVIRN